MEYNHCGHTIGQKHVGVTHLEDVSTIGPRRVLSHYDLHISKLQMEQMEKTNTKWKSH